MAERSLEDELFGEDDAAAADEGADKGKTPEADADETGDKDDDTPPSDPAKDADKSKDGDDTDDDEDEEAGVGKDAPKDGAQDKDKSKDDKDKAAADEPMVPKKALDSEKRRRRELAARLKRIEDRLASEDAEAARKAVPDPKKDPAAYSAYVAQQQAHSAINDRLNFSEFQARKDEGEEAVDAAFEWANEQMEADKTGAFAKKLFAHASPYHYAVQLHKEAQEAGNGGEGGGAKDPEYEEFLAWQRSRKGGGEKQPGDKPKDQPGEERAARPKSLAQRPSASGPAKSDKDNVDSFDAEFGS